MKILKHRLFWPAAALAALILINTISRPTFLSITVQDGRLYGSLIDILRNSAPLMLVALGMTIVIATRGIDLSVGAIMAVSGAVALTIISNSADPNGLGTFYVSVAAIALVALIERRTALGVLTEAVGINPEASRLAGVRSRGIVWGAYAASGLLAGFAGILYSSNIMAADANAAGLYIELDAILAVVLGGTSLMGGKFTIAGTVIGVFTIQTLKSTITFLGVPPAVSPLFLAIVVVIVVLVQSRRVRGWFRLLWTSARGRSVSRTGDTTGVTS